MNVNVINFSDFILKTPFRSPFSPFFFLKKYITNKNILDLGCGSGDLLYFLKKYLDANVVFGIDMNNNTKNNNVPIKIENIMNFDFKNDQFDTYISWIETPEVEIFVINELIKKSIKTTYIIAYSSEQMVCNNCSLCAYLKCIPNKKKN